MQEVQLLVVYGLALPCCDPRLQWRSRFQPSICGPLATPSCSVPFEILHDRDDHGQVAVPPTRPSKHSGGFAVR
jgi:hypothetical protein